MLAIGFAIFFSKVVRYDYPLTPDTETTVWDFEIYLEFSASNRPVRIETFIPARSVGRDVSEEQFYNGPFGLRLDEEEASGNRKAVWTYRFPQDRKVLRYRAQLLGESGRTPLPDSMREKRRRSTPQMDSDLERQAFIVWSSDLRRRSADDDSLAELTLQQIFEARDVDEVNALLSSLPRPVAQLELARAVLVSQGIPARVANGVYLDDARRRAEIQHWLEYHVSGEDKRFFPNGEPARFFALWYGVEEVVAADGVSELDVQIGLQQARFAAQDLALSAGARGDWPVQLFSFDQLPITTQLVYKVLVTIPVGILLLVFLRQFIGLQTLGTFMPVLIGIAFRETALLTGVFLFTLLVVLGLTVRFYLERLRLLLVPRLAVVLVFIVMCMAGFTIMMASGGQRLGLSISLFPMVILTMTIERMSIVWEEYSAEEAIKQGLGSLAVAAVSYLAMTHPQVEYLMFTFPELLLVIMALCLLMGKYTGLRLSELIRFRELAGKAK
ncbi:MAG: UUP1 family membrane protein [Pseudomonadota bacterium]